MSISKNQAEAPMSGDAPVEPLQTLIEAADQLIADFESQGKSWNRSAWTPFDEAAAGLRGFRDEVVAALRASRSEPPALWQPIETGPEAMWVLVMVPNYGMNIATMTRDPNILGPHGNFWFIRGEEDRCWPTHWMPLPAPPADGKDQPA